MEGFEKNRDPRGVEHLDHTCCLLVKHGCSRAETGGEVHKTGEETVRRLVCAGGEPPGGVTGHGHVELAGALPHH